MAFGAPLVFATTTDVGMEPAYPNPNNERSQSIFIMEIKPGDRGENGVRLINSSKETRTVEVYPIDSVSSVSGSFSCRQRAEKIKDVGAWITLKETKITLVAGEQKTIDFTIDVPKSAGPGEHDGCIAVQDTANLPAKSGSGVLLGVRSAIRVAVTVPGKIIKKLNIVRVDIKHIENRGISVSPVAKNGGNVSLDVTARAQLVSIFGQETKVKSNAKYPIMQGATMGWAYAFEGPYWGGIYKARTSLSYNADPSLGIGQGESNLQRIRKDSDWFIAYPSPLAAIAEIAVLAAVVWLAITPLRRRMQHRRVSKNWQKYTVSGDDTLAAIAKKYAIKWKKLAKRNHIKAPYLLEKGQILFVPVISKTNKKAKKPKIAKIESDWLSDTPIEPVAEEETSEVKDESQRPASELPKAEPSTDWQAPQYAPNPSRQEPSEAYYQTKARVPQPHVVTSNPMFPEPEDAAIPDWRDGASEDELRQFGAITDSSSVSQIQGSWDIDDEDTVRPAKKPAAKRQSASTTRKTAKSTSKKASAKQSTKKKR